MHSVEMKQNDHNMAARRSYVRRTLIEILALGTVYFITVSVTHLSIPCPIHALTGYLCPGCGITHMFLSLFHLKFIEAFHSNPYVFIILPILLVFFFHHTRTYIYNGNENFSIPETIFLAFAFLGAVIFMILRNKIL